VRRNDSTALAYQGPADSSRIGSASALGISSELELEEAAELDESSDCTSEPQ
jgi:hypothetical protein